MNRLAHFRRLFFPVAVFGFAAGTVSFAAQNSKAFTEDEKINGRVEGYYVRVKSGVSGEKQIYYNADGSLKNAGGDGLLGGDFSLDSSLLSSDGDGTFDFNFPAEKKETPVPANFPPKAAASVPAAPAVPAKKTPAAVPASGDSASFDDSEGTVDENSILKKFSKTKRQSDFGMWENRGNIFEMKNAERFSEKFSIKEWQGSSVYGLRRYSEDFETRDMERAETRGNAIPMSRFETSSQTPGERMFVRSDDGAAIEVLFDRRFSMGERFSASARVQPLRETSGFSMQDINRYQFRRNRSSEEGFPVVSPDSGERIRRENFGKKTAPER